MGQQYLVNVEVKPIIVALRFLQHG
ncbi:uncharacterized protein METZ01_LOCUS212299 [marine metagenome]|uniref:Uncharacterized protein n=1 Tax=marine metagenome TaxID=408172 RepID=A0A382F9U6_9ZZZZ